MAGKQIAAAVTNNNSECPSTPCYCCRLDIIRKTQQVLLFVVGLRLILLRCDVYCCRVSLWVSVFFTFGWVWSGGLPVIQQGE